MTDAIVSNLLIETLLAENGQLFLDNIVVEVMHDTTVAADVTEYAAATDSTPSVTGIWNITQTEHADALDWLVTRASGGGGGGAAGRYGNGENGEAGRLDGVGGYGGFGDTNLTPYQPTPGATGNTGTEWNGVIGSGSGGAGGNWSDTGVGQDGGTGGLYGGGGGGGGGGVGGGGHGALGGAGVIYLQYVSSVTSLIVKKTLLAGDPSPYVIPADWTDSNLIILLGAGGCGGNGSFFTGGNGGEAGDCVGVEDFDGFNPGDEIEVSITSATDACLHPGTNPGSGFGGFHAGAGGNGAGTPDSGGGTSGTPGGISSGFPGGFTFDPGNGGPGGEFHTLRFVRNVDIEEPADASDKAVYTLIKPAKPPGPKPPVIATNIPSATAQQPYPPVPTSQNDWYGWNQQLARTTNLVLAGKMNNTLASFTFNANSPTTTLYMSQIGATSVIQMTPLTANAAAERWHVSSQKQGEATIAHSDSDTTDRTFSVMVVS